MAKHSDVNLSDVFTATSGSVLMSGIQAIVRASLEQMWLDRGRGLSTGSFVSGYPGSPLGTVDMEFDRAKRYCDPANIHFHHAINEELAATAVVGTQLVDQLPGADVDGAVGYWFGKNPGLDRAADALRHGNYMGTSPLGGLVAFIGDDPSSKSSTLPSSSAEMCESMLIPAFNPSTIAEMVSYTLHGVAMSRASGTIAAVRVVTELADAAAVVDLVDPATYIESPDPGREIFRATLLGARAVEAEQHLFEVRLPKTIAYAKANHLNKVVFEASRPTFGIIASGTTYSSLLRAFEILGVDEQALEQMGIRLIKIGLIWPLDHQEFRDFTAGLQTVFVVEDKRPFLELHIRDALYGAKNLPLILGKHDVDGSPLIPTYGAMDVDGILAVLAKVLLRHNPPERVVAEIERIARPKRRLKVASLPVRQPYFCSGCPHNRSTMAGADELVGVGIGCHVMVAFQDETRGHHVGLTQMGGEGTQWIGAAPFMGKRHFVQNLGDGTFFHSGSLAIRAAVAANLNVTYKLLYNRAVAMTGGQTPPGGFEIPALTKWLALEGVRKVIITTPEPERYEGVTLDPIATVRHRDDIADLSREFAAVEGVTVMIHDDRCAAEERRLRKRGLVETPKKRIAINARVCEGCGDCQAKSTCLSVEPVMTDFGDKTQIHQSSCNFDFSCVEGDCPSFLQVIPGKKEARVVPTLPVELVDPVRIVPGHDASIRMAGVGGTGVVTVSRILQMAARLDGLHASGLDQTGLSQKGGPVISDVRIAKAQLQTAPKASEHTIDLVLGFDLLGVLSPIVADKIDHERTVAVLNLAATPTHDQLTRSGPKTPTEQEVHELLEPLTRAEHNVYVNALQVAEAVVGDHLAANLVLLGAAFQAGCLPLSAKAIEGAIAMNGSSVEENLTAFSWGRAVVLDQRAVMAVVAPEVEAAKAATDAVVVQAVQALSLSPGAQELVTARGTDLVAFGSRKGALSYVKAVGDVAERLAGAESATRDELVSSYARNAYKLRAYKDEYEVARLHLLPETNAEIIREFGHGAKVSVLLQPPMLKAFGIDRKIALRHTARPAFVVLRAMRRLRGTFADPFGYTTVRRIERALIGEYDRLVDRALERDPNATLGLAREVFELPDLIRGYESVKLENVVRFRERSEALFAERPQELASTTR